MNTLTLVGAELEEVLFGDSYADRTICEWWNSNDTYTTNLLRYAVNNGGIELLNHDRLSDAINGIDDALAVLDMALTNDLFVKDENGWFIYPPCTDIRLHVYEQEMERTMRMLQIRLDGKETTVEIVGL